MPSWPMIGPWRVYENSPLTSPAETGMLIGNAMTVGNRALSMAIGVPTVTPARPAGSPVKTRLPWLIELKLIGSLKAIAIRLGEEETAAPVVGVVAMTRS